MEKIAFFDFCETLVDFQTADAFVHFVRRKYGNKRMNRINQLVSFLNKTYIIVLIEWVMPNRSLNKRLVLWQLKGVPQDAIERYANEYYNEMIKPHLIPQMIELLHNLQGDGYRAVLVSGGYYQYLKFFAADNSISEEDIISTRIGSEDNVCTGKFDGRDCMGQNKVVLLNNRFDKAGIQSIAFSDSISDLPLLLWADERYVVSRDKAQEWAEKNSFKQIVWHQKSV